MAKLIRNLGGQIATTLRGEILTGALAEGDVLQETILADRFGVSRGPVRDALLELAKEGMVVPGRSRGATVASSAPESIHQLVLPIRHTLEKYALEQLFKDLNDECFEVWDDLLEQMRRACVNADEAGIIETDIAIHRSILELAGQPDLLAIWTTIVNRIRRYFLRDNRRYSDPMDHYSEHVALIDAFRTRNIKIARKALTDHIVK